MDEAVLRALAKAPADRHQTVDAFAEALGVPVFVATPPTGVATPVEPGEDVLVRTPPTNLPHTVTRFVGREREIADVRRWLERARLVTLVGPGGIGKTRLALETAARVLDQYRD